MKITLGEWKTRDGRKAIVAAMNPHAHDRYRFIGWLDDSVRTWHDNGLVVERFQFSADLIAPWTDPVPWDWSTTPPWCVCLVQGPHEDWFLCDKEVDIGSGGLIFNGDGVMCLPEKYSPQWSGDWKLSKTMRPKGVAK